MKKHNAIIPDVTLTIKKFYHGLLKVVCFKHPKRSLLTKKSYAVWNYIKKNCQQHAYMLL